MIIMLSVMLEYVRKSTNLLPHNVKNQWSQIWPAVIDGPFYYSTTVVCIIKMYLSA